MSTVAINLTLCDIRSIKTFSIPLECLDDGSDMSLCIEAISRSSQLWSSYSGYFRESLTICQSLKSDLYQHYQLEVLNKLLALFDKFNSHFDKDLSVFNGKLKLQNSIIIQNFLNLNNKLDELLIRV